MKLLVDGCWLKCVLCGLPLWFAAQEAGAATVLFIGAGATASTGDDGLVFTRLQSLFGPGNATYLQDAASSTASADGIDALVISSTVVSGNVRGKFENSTVGILNWEPAYMDCRAGTAGQLCLSSGGSAEAGTLISEINIVDPLHPLAVGLSGTVQIFNSPQRSTTGAGDLGAEEQLVAESTVNSERYAIWGIDIGEPLAGDGTPQNPNIAAGRRVSFPLFDDTFHDLTPEGLDLFDAAAQWVANIIGVPGDVDGDEDVDMADYFTIRDAFQTAVGSREEGDLNRDGIVNLNDFAQWKSNFPTAAPEAGLGTAVPEPSTGLLLLAGSLAMTCIRTRRVVG